MLHKLKMTTLNARDYSQKEGTSQPEIQWASLFKTIQKVVLIAIPIMAVALSVLSDFLFFKEIASASFLILLISFINIAGGKS
ncbi:hypothetical protein [Dokdonia sp. Asnod1-B02]|uniref:hypothetical protein n=1 Tax=Dokdonia sp. Asnod1-B02 TaxID=3160573 RepID=UPI00386DF2D1